MSGSEAGDASNSKRQRVSRACDLCRRKKIKCDGLLPVCTNCQAFTLECSYNDTAKKRGPPKGYIEAIENRLHRLEQLLAEVAEDIDETRSKKVLAELHAPLETPYGESIKTRPTRRRRKAQMNRIFLWQQKNSAPNSSSPASPTSSTQLLESPSGLGEEEEQHSDASRTSDSGNNVNGQLSMDETGQMRYIGKSSGLYYIQNSRWYHNGAFHLAELTRKKNNITYHNKALLDPLELPPKDISYELISIYFAHFYPVLPMFYKKRLVLTCDPHSDVVSPLLLNAIYALSSRISPDIRVRSDPNSSDTAGEVFFERAKIQLDNYYDVPKISTVQALLLLAVHQHGAMKGPRAWLYSGMAFRMAQDLGLHRNCDHWNIPLEERERRKRVFWCCFIMDRLLSATYGRASLFEERDCDVPFPAVDDDEVFSNGEGQGVRVLDAFVHQIKICDILGHVLKSIYYAKGRYHAGTPHLDRVLAGLRRKLDNWYNTMPPSLRYNLQDGAMCHDLPSPVSQIHMIYYTTLILLYRPFLSPDQPFDNTCMICADAISDIVENIQKDNHLKFASNFVVYYTFIAGTLFVKAATSSDENKSRHAKGRVEKIMRALAEFETVWPSATRCRSIIGELAGLCGDRKHADPLVRQQQQQQQQQQASVSAATTAPIAPITTSSMATSDMYSPSLYTSMRWENVSTVHQQAPVSTVDPFAAPGTVPIAPMQQQQPFDTLAAAAFWGSESFEYYLGGGSSGDGMTTTTMAAAGGGAAPLIPSHEFSPFQPKPDFSTKHLIHTDTGVDVLSGQNNPVDSSDPNKGLALLGFLGGQADLAGPGGNPLHY